jgi:hypothetical protein
MIECRAAPQRPGRRVPNPPASGTSRRLVDFKRSALWKEPPMSLEQRKNVAAMVQRPTSTRCLSSMRCGPDSPR